MPFWSPTFFSCSSPECHCSTWSLPWASTTGKGQLQFGKCARSLKVTCSPNTQIITTAQIYEPACLFTSTFIWPLNLCLMLLSHALFCVMPFHFIPLFLPFPLQRFISVTCNNLGHISSFFVSPLYFFNLSACTCSQIPCVSLRKEGNNPWTWLSCAPLLSKLIRNRSN